MRIFTIFLMSVLIFPSTLFSQEVSVKEAQNIAKNFFYKNAKFNKSKNYKSLKLSLSHVEAEEQNFFYVFEVQNQKGFVITSAQGFTKPILGYSDQNNVDFTNLSPELRFMLDYYKKQIQYGIDNNIRASSKVSQMWQELRFASQNRTSVTEPVGPLLLTEWNQSPYYNDMCPANSSGELTVAGCVAVAMAQIMKFYDYPEQGTESHYHYDSHGSVFHSSNINFANQTYRWENMPISLDKANEDVAKLMYHCGQSVNMDWEVDGSGTYTQNVEFALKDFFKYSSSVQFVEKDYYYSDSQWEQLIRDEMNAKRPIIFAGHSSASMEGHAWNCDGYQSDGNGGYLYHMNYGWGGSGNGYFALNNLLSISLPGEDPDYFDTSFRIVKGIKPSSGYPAHCTEERIVTGKEGVFGDGSGNQDYQNNLNCKTIISRECYNGSATVWFERFDLGSGDQVTLHDGEDETAPILGQFDANNLPEGEYTSSSGKMLIHFVTDGTGTAGGWDLSYSTKACGNAHIEAPSGTITDGSGLCNYKPKTNCYWHIEPTNASQITLSFSEFNLDIPEHDYLKIYKNTEQSVNLVTKLQGTNIPSEDIVIDAERVIIKFKAFSDENVGTGWTLDYSSNVVGIKPVLAQTQDFVKIYPNPFKDDAIINIDNPTKENVVITLTNTIGQTIATKQINNIEEKMSLELSEISHQVLKQGVYFLNVRIGSQIQTLKLVSE